MRPSVIVVAISMLAACGGLAYLHVMRGRAAEQEASVSNPPSIPQAVPPAPVAAPADDFNANTDAATHTFTRSDEPTSAPPLETSDPIARLIKDTESDDATVRAAAIAALAEAPKAQAMPALKRVLENGEPAVDRQIALRSLHSLALRDGDENGQIRDAMRDALYHGDDEGVTQTAQSLLEDVEAAFALREQPPQ
jgi:hypothetical protein